MLALITSLALALPLDAGLTIGGGYGMNAGNSTCLNDGFSTCSTATAKGPAGSAGLYALYRVGPVGVGARGESTVIFGQDRGVSAAGLALVRLGDELYAEAGIGVGWARFSEPISDIPEAGRIASTDVGGAGILGFGATVAPHIAITARGGIITGTPGFAYVVGGLDFQL